MQSLVCKILSGSVSVAQVATMQRVQLLAFKQQVASRHQLDALPERNDGVCQCHANNVNHQSTTHL